MAVCGQCKQDGGEKKFCTNCGAPMVEPAAPAQKAQASGVRLGDIGFVKGNITDSSTVTTTTTNVGQINIGMPAGTSPAAPCCPICGEYPELRESFRCMACGRDYICKRHRHPEQRICTACVRRREMVWVPPGGSFDGFWMDRAKVTCEAYRRFLVANPGWQKGSVDGKRHDGYYLRDWNGNDYPAGKGGQPVVYVSWYAARACAEWSGKRLPTEAEWEYGCRAGTNTAYWWGDEFALGRAAEANPWGLRGMSGCLWEWTSSPFSDDPADAGPRSCRGGSKWGDAAEARSSARSGRAPRGCSVMVGFRCVESGDCPTTKPLDQM